MSLTWQGKLFGVGILVFAAYAMWGGFADGREVDRRAELGACGLASTYVEWRMAFDAGQRGATTIEGAALDTFVRENDLFERAAQRSSGASVAHSLVLSRLRSTAAHDSDRKNETVASVEPFLDAFFEGCPVEAVSIMARLGG